MPTYTCEKCARIFKQKSGYTDHLKKKIDCTAVTAIAPILEEMKEIKRELQEMKREIEFVEPVEAVEVVKDVDFSKKSLDELKAFCRENNIKGYSGKKKSDIIQLIQNNKSVLSDKHKEVLTNEIVDEHKEVLINEIVDEHKEVSANELKFIEVCAGCGGLSSGFIEAGFTPILVNEVIKTFCNTLKKNHPGINVVEGSMVDLDLKSYKGKVDVLQGGVPCQAFSQAGERKGLEDPRGQLITQFNNLINDCEPKIFLVENVKGLITHNDGKTFKDIITLFENDGKYKVYHKVLNAKDYDVPQKRERVLIIGVHSSIKKSFTYPEKSKNTILLRDVLTNVPDSIGAKYPESKAKIMDLVPQGGCWVDLPEDIQKKYMGEKGLAAGGGKRGIARRLSMDEQSLTLTTSPCQKQTERCHPIETRPLNVREYARIQTFPDSYIFEGSMGNQYKQIGNAVPVKLALAIAKQIKHFLEQP